MKSLWILALAALPLATLTAREWLDSPSGDDSAMQSAAVAIKNAAALSTVNREAIAAMKQLDCWSLENPVALENEKPSSSLMPVSRSLTAWNAAKRHIDTFLNLSAERLSDDVARLRNLEDRWQSFRQRLAAAKLAGSEPMMSFASRRSGEIARQIARLNAANEAVSAAAAVKSAFGVGHYEVCAIRAQQWLSTHANHAPASLVEEIKTLELRSEFHAERERSRGRLKTVASATEKAAVLATFLQRYAGNELLNDSECAVIEQCRRYLDKLRAEIAQAEQLHRASVVVQTALENLPSRLEDRLAVAAEIYRRQPQASIQAVLQGRVLEWLEESLPEKSWDEPEGICEAETTSSRVIRGYVRKVSTTDGAVGYKFYDTPAQRDRPTFDVGTWLASDLIAPPGVSRPRQWIERFNKARAELLQRPSEKIAWDTLAAACERLQAECDAYRVKTGAANKVPNFRREADFARRTAWSAALLHLQTIWENPNASP